MNSYNYKDFSPKQYNFNKFDGIEIGERAKDFTVTNIEGKDINLLDFKGKFLVLEFGSITCPLFQGRREGMSKLVKQYSDVSFSIIYVREAHPGNKLPAHKSLKDKISCAIKLRAQNENRRILIDNIEGSVHSSYGNYPNAIYIINKNGCVVYMSDWNNVATTKKALNLLLDGYPAQVRNFFIPVHPKVIIHILKKSGDGVLKDFLITLPKLMWKNLIIKNFLLFFSRKKLMVRPDSTC